MPVEAFASICVCIELDASKYCSVVAFKTVVPLILNDLPDAKVIILLRDPINRAYSHFNHIQEKNPSWGSYAYGKSFDTVAKNYSLSNIFQRSFYKDNLTTW